MVRELPSVPSDGNVLVPVMAVKLTLIILVVASDYGIRNVVTITGEELVRKWSNDNIPVVRYVILVTKNKRI